jgi:hypothetical protein
MPAFAAATLHIGRPPPPLQAIGFTKSSSTAIASRCVSRTEPSR